MIYYVCDYYHLKYLSTNGNSTNKSTTHLSPSTTSLQFKTR